MVSPVPAKTFTVELERVQKTATMFRVPFDLESAFGRARPPVVPRDLADALAADPAATKAFRAMSFRHRREYVEWVEEAKRAESRARGIPSTVEHARDREPAP
jgi:hypothetical protein